MERKNLTQYVFWDGSETICAQNGKVIAVKDREDYLPLGMRFAPRVQGSAPNLNDFVGFSDVPKVGEHLATFRGVLIFGRHYVSNSNIREINKYFEFDKENEK